MKNPQKLIYSGENEIRLDHFLSETMQISRNAVKKLIETGCVEGPAGKIKPSLKIRPGTEILVQEIEIEQSDIQPVKREFEIIYEDEDFLAISKPAGLVVHPAPSWKGITLVNMIRDYLGDNLPSVNFTQRSGIVHRLDKDTSGLMLLGKSTEGFNNLLKIFENRTIDKYYLAILKGHLSEKLRIELSIGRDPQSRVKMAVGGLASRDAVTEVYPLNHGDKYTLALIKILTGRTHQIRVHLAYAGFPVFGDEVYGTSSNSKILNRQALHSFAMKLAHPVNQQPVKLICNPDKDFQNFVEQKMGLQINWEEIDVWK